MNKVYPWIFGNFYVCEKNSNKANVNILKEGIMKGFTVKMIVVILVLGMAGVSYGAPKIVGKSVGYTSQGVTFKGYLAYDENLKGKRLGVLVLHGADRSI